ncbi:MAG: hydrolase, partial [Alphaproteobacteria bacterium]|nr:hydrolase [Alphaproteobacteria bacterium]MDX5415861.1 hydrolase [Alphaproteobacteria bacterium]MDX5493146.1 hydrolase [Alphaproteobacteria bacterium]
MTESGASSKRAEEPGADAPEEEAAPGRPWHHLADGTFRNPKGCPSRGQGRMRHAGPFFLEMLKMGARKVEVPEGHVVPRGAAVR